MSITLSRLTIKLFDHKMKNEFGPPFVQWTVLINVCEFDCFSVFWRIPFNATSFSLQPLYQLKVTFHANTLQCWFPLEDVIMMNAAVLRVIVLFLSFSLTENHKYTLVPMLKWLLWRKWTPRLSHPGLISVFFSCESLRSSITFQTTKAIYLLINW